jgi:hypothetical protein
MIAVGANMIGFWKKIENDGYDGFLVILFKLGNLKKTEEENNYGK